MASLKTWRVLHGAEQVTTVDAHHLTIEPSGALSFWAVTPDNMQAILMFGFAAAHWRSVAILDSEDEGGA